MMERLKFEREFFRLAGFAFACRLRVFGEQFGCDEAPEAPLALSLLGLSDATGEMKLLCREVLR